MLAPRLNYPGTGWQVQRITNYGLESGLRSKHDDLAPLPHPSLFPNLDLLECSRTGPSPSFLSSLPHSSLKISVNFIEPFWSTDV